MSKPRHLYDLGDIPGIEVPLPPDMEPIDQPPRSHRIAGGWLILAAWFVVGFLSNTIQE